MKRTRATTKAFQQETFTAEEHKNEESTSTQVTAPVALEERPKLNLKSLRNQSSNNASGTLDPSVVASSKKFKNLHNESSMEAFFENAEEFKPTMSPGKGKRRAVVDLKMMKEELSQLEDPPVTPWVKELSSNRLQYDFFDVPCEELAQKLLGKILVRCFENGIVLKGRIVETEGYLGTIDKASHSYQNKVTARNAPMFMPPGTIYVYMTYGMYHCFNISSQEGNAYVTIKALEPLMGLEYMELLRNMRYKNNGREKQIARRVIHLKQYELCNSPSKICHAFAIDQDTFDQKLAYACNNIWLEKQPFVNSLTVVSVPPKDHNSDEELHFIVGKVLGAGCAVLIRAIDPLEGIKYMADQRNTSTKTKKTDLKPHELCNGPAKLCMAYQLNRQHSRYSLCTWKSLWIEDDTSGEDFKIIKSTRIGIDSYGTEWASKLLRYYVYGNKSVSKKDKKAETKVS